MDGSHLRVLYIPVQELVEWVDGRGLAPLPELASLPSPLPTTPPHLDKVATPFTWDSSTIHIDPSSRPNRQLAPSTTAGTPDPVQNAPTTELTPPHPLHTSSDSSTDLAIRLLKPQPTQGCAVILPRIETHVYLDIVLPSRSWNAIQLPLTKSVIGDDSSSIGEGSRPLLLVIIVRGATTGQEYNCVCEQCEKRLGRKTGPPSLIDFHGPSNILAPKRGTVQVHFTFSCYSRHHRTEDEQYVLEVILKDASNPSEPIEVARKELPYSFDVRSSRPRTRKPTRGQTRQTDIGPSSNIRRGAKQLATPSPPPSAQLAEGPHPEGLKRQIRPEQMAGGVSDNGRAGQRKGSHASSIGKHEQQNLSDIQSLPSAVAVFYASGVPKPPLLVQHRRGLSGGEDRDSLEEGSVGMNPPHSASDPGAQHIPGGSIRNGWSYRAPDIPREQRFSSFAPAHHPSIHSPHIPTNTEKVQAKVAERVLHIQALETRISYLGGTFGVESQGTEAAVNAKVADLEAQIHSLKQENSYAASDLTMITKITKSHSPCIG